MTFIEKLITYLFKLKLVDGSFFKLSFPAEAEQAFAIAKANRQITLEGFTLSNHLDGRIAEPKMTSEDLFSLNGTKLPCWRKEDIELEEEKWLTATNYYPLYFEVFKGLQPDKGQRVKFLEFGVRTGYMGAVFMKAIEGAKSYMGIDPNLYLKDGLERATATLELLTQDSTGTNYQFIKGYSTFQAYLGSMQEYGPFDFIHIDGEHTLKGKVIDLFVAKDLVKKGGYVLVDDFNHVGIVAPAVKAALEKGWYSTFTYVPTLRGLAILTT